MNRASGLRGFHDGLEVLDETMESVENVEADCFQLIIN